jgi:hypothetical protein
MWRKCVSAAELGIFSGDKKSENYFDGRIVLLVNLATQSAVGTFFECKGVSVVQAMWADS